MTYIRAYMIIQAIDSYLQCACGYHIVSYGRTQVQVNLLCNEVKRLLGGNWVIGSRGEKIVTALGTRR